MDTMIFLLALTTLPSLVAPLVSIAPFKAVVEIVTGHPRIFSGENFKLKCNISDAHKSIWGYMWFRESEELPQLGEHLFLWNVHVKDSGNYSCKGVRDTMVGKAYTLQSESVEIHVDGGWAILHVPPHPSVVGDSVIVTCYVRDSPKHLQVILYKDGVEVMSSPYRHFHLTNLNIEDRGMYSCRASWDTEMGTHSIISIETPFQILEILSEPVLVIATKNDLNNQNMMRLICNHQYSAHAPAPPVRYYFYRNDRRLGIATSENHFIVNRTPGQYSCRVTVPKLDLNRSSKHESYGDVADMFIEK